MKKITLQKISLCNFKGIQHAEFEFGKTTDIKGANGTGKTTIFDAFLWCLFGKSSNNRKDFGIKTYDRNGVVIPRISHEVAMTIDVNKEVIQLRKCLTEKWTKRRGSAEEVFTGNQVECYYNDVPLSVSEYTAKIASICDEQSFELITNPLYFTSQKKDVQRAFIFDLAGGVTDDEAAKGYTDFVELVAKLSGKTLDEYKREIAAKKRRIKDSIETIPARIDECRRTMPEAQNWAEIELQISANNNKISKLDNEITNRQQAFNAKTNEIDTMYIERTRLLSALSEARVHATDGLHKAYYEQKRAHEKTISEYALIKRDRQTLKTITLPRLKKDIETLIAEQDAVRNEWHAVNSQTFVEPDRKNFVCPTCRRLLEAEDIDARIDQMRKSFNANKARQKEALGLKGCDYNEPINKRKKDAEHIEDEIFKFDAQLAEIENSEAYKAEPVEPDYEAAVKASDEVKQAREALEAQEAAIAKKENEVGTANVDQLYREKDQLHKANAELSAQLRVREIIGKTNERIASLEAEYRTQQDELAQLEGEEYTIQQFRKHQVNLIESKVNHLFDIVRFKMFETQINGGEAETCEAMVDGVPFSDLNTALKINAGLDIINAICRAKEVSAPIFIDNRESVSDIISTEAQIINLIVDDTCSQLTSVSHD